MSTKKSHIIPRVKATEYQQRLIHVINERDKIRGEYHEEMKYAENANHKALESEFQSSEQKRHRQVYERHAAQSVKLKQRIHELEKQIHKLVETLEKGGYETNKNTGRITPKY